MLYVFNALISNLSIVGIIRLPLCNDMPMKLSSYVKIKKIIPPIPSTARTPFRIRGWRLPDFFEPVGIGFQFA